MRKIILVSNTSWYLFNFRLSIIKMFQQMGYHVICIANHDTYSDKLVNEGVQFVESKIDNKGTNPVNDLMFFLFLLRQYLKIKPAFIFHYTIKPNIYSSLAARILGIRSIAVVSGAGYAFLKKGLLNSFVKKSYKLAAKCCQEMWFVNKDDRQMFLEAGIVSEQKTKVLPGEGINTDFFQRTHPYNNNGNEFIFLLSARLLWDKGVGVYIQAARSIHKNYRNVRFQLLGFIDALNPSAISKEQIVEWEKEGIIEYLGVTEDVRTYLNSASCFVLPSYYREGVPRALLEAASLEIPIITTDNVGCREVVKDGYNGFLCRPKDHDHLAERMKAVIEMDRNTLRTMGKNGRQKVISEFREELVLKYYEDVISSILKVEGEANIDAAN